MLAQIDLEALANRHHTERAFLSVYLNAPNPYNILQPRLQKSRAVISDDPVELEHFEKNEARIAEYLANYSFKGPAQAVAVFACAADDWLEAFDLEKRVDQIVWAGSGPYIRPLAELQDEYENFVAVVADNRDAHVYYVTSARPEQEERIKGDVKNHVKVGGWSQRRYASRRDNQLLHYAKEIVETLEQLAQEKDFDRIVIVGGEEILNEVRANFPKSLSQKQVDYENVNVKDNEQVWSEIWSQFTTEERSAEKNLWRRIRDTYLEGGRAAVGFDEVIPAALVGRVEKAVVNRNTKATGRRCRDCDNTFVDKVEKCPACGSDSLYEVDLVNELARLAETTSAEIDFSDPIPALEKAGNVAALLRY